MSFSTRELEIISMAFRCSKDPAGIKIDYEKLAAMGKFKNSASASASWGPVRKKLLANNADASRTSATKSAAKNGTGGVPDDDDDDRSAKFTPINTPKKKKRVVKSEERIDRKIEEDENDEVAPATVSDSITLGQTGETYIKKEDKEGEGAQPVLSAPSKKRVRKAKDDYETTSSKRIRGAPVDTVATGALTQKGEQIPSSATIIPAKVDDSNGLVHVETPLEEPQSHQGN